MKQLMGVINLVHEPDDLEELTIYRNTACVPFGGRYRLIDFMLSNMVNSGIGNVAVFTHHKYRSLMDHLGSGKEWDLDRKRGGLFLLPSLGDGSNGTARGDLFQLYTNRDFFIVEKNSWCSWQGAMWSAIFSLMRQSVSMRRKSGHHDYL
ncbi:sugar phosphate nucleotidyltransferase [Paenibacillus larvae]|nr:sugar phosphate nucleotidyltransferase [Paenibacillus larvae]